MLQNITTERLHEQASCAMFAVLCKWRTFNLPVDITLDLLVSYTKVWGVATIDVVEKLHLGVLKYI